LLTVVPRTRTWPALPTIKLRPSRGDNPLAICVIRFELIEFLYEISSFARLDKSILPDLAAAIPPSVSLFFEM